MADAGKDRGKAVKIVLAPNFEGVLMAFGTFEPDAEEQLTDGRSDFDRVGTIAENDRGSVAPSTPLGGNQLADELVIGEVLAKGGSQPCIQVPDGLDTDTVGIGPEKVRPFVGPEVGVFGTVEELVNESVTFVRRSISEKGAGFLGRGEPADHSEVGTAQKRGIGSGAGGEHAEEFQLLPNQVVDFVFTREGTVEFFGNFFGERNRDRTDGNVIHVANHHGGFTGMGPAVFTHESIRIWPSNFRNYEWSFP